MLGSLVVLEGEISGLGDLRRWFRDQADSGASLPPETVRMVASQVVDQLTGLGTMLDALRRAIELSYPDIALPSD